MSKNNANRFSPEVRERAVRLLLELAALEWVARFNHKRLHSSIGYIPPAEAEANYYNLLGTSAGERHARQPIVSFRLHLKTIEQ
ncbi:hypothetical protein BOSP111201_09435 [Bordetella sputigena]